MDFRQLHPRPATVDVEALLSALELGDRAPADRPYTLVNFVTTLDGRATFGGRSGPLGDDGDRAMFHGLREQVDAILAGTKTMETESYGRIIGKPERRKRRAARGATPEPLATIVSRSGHVPTDIPLFAEAEAKVVVFCPERIDMTGCQAHVEQIQLDPAELTLTTALQRLRTDFGVRSLLCEGGPTLFGALLHERLVDELFLTLAPKLTGGGTGPTISSGPELAEPESAELTWLLERNGSLYHRYALH